METIADRIWHVMKIKDLRISELAKICEVSTQYFYNIKTGKINRPLNTKIKNFMKIGINPDWIMNGTGEMEVSDFMPPTPTVSADTPPNAYLMDMMAKIESGFRATMEQKEQVIQHQQYVIEMLKYQLNLSLGKFDVSKWSPVIEEVLDSEIEFKMAS